MEEKIAPANGIEIAYEEFGARSDPTMLLIMGLGYSSCLWHRTRPVLAQRYRTVAFDNRGQRRDPR